MSTIKIVFFGTSNFACPILEKLSQESYNIVAVITKPDQFSGRKKILTPPPLKIAAQKLSLKILQPLKSKGGQNLKSDLLNLKPDLGIVASYGQIISPEIIVLFPRGLLNIHPSLLPKYRGPSPIQTAVLKGEKETGVTAMQLDEKMDHGPILKSVKYQMSSTEYYSEIEKKLAQLGAKLLLAILPDYLQEKLRPRAQDHTQATFTQKFTLTDGKINWHQPAVNIHRQIRALNPEPGTWTVWNGKKLKIAVASFFTGQPHHQHDPSRIGRVYQEKDLVYVPAQHGHLQLTRVQLEGGRELTIADFIRGHTSLVGTQLAS